MAKKTTTDQNKVSKKKMNQNSHPMLKNKMMMKGNDHDIAMDSVNIFERIDQCFGV